MKCLNCDAEMMNHLVQTKNDQIAYDLCEACGSLWLDAGELDKLAFQVDGSIEFSSKEPAENTLESKKKCPRCDNMVLDKVHFIGYTDIVLDRCGNCQGFWLDGGELDLINSTLEKIMPVSGKGFSEFVNKVHLPYWYKRIRRKSSETDFHVKVSPLMEAAFQSKTSKTCPVCQVELNQYSIYGIQIEGCPDCKGIFLDKDELRKLKDKVDTGSWTSLRWMDDEVEALNNMVAMPSKRICPSCTDSAMVSANFANSGVILDWCPSCAGIWLDRNEYQQIIQFLRDKLDHYSSDEMKEKTYEEIKEIWNGPHDMMSEILDAKAAIAALVNISIFEHPKLCNSLLSFTRAVRAAGL